MSESKNHRFSLRNAKTRLSVRISAIIAALLMPVFMSAFVPTSALAGNVDSVDWQVEPSELTLDGPLRQAQLVVLQQLPAAETAAQVPERRVDATRDVIFGSSNPHVVTVDDRGQLTAVADGEAVNRERLGKRRVGRLLNGVIGADGEIELGEAFTEAVGGLE